ncbi:GT2 family glycosyltransferase [Rhizobium sp. PP-F2F-G38]|nr:GT2 family glycosyltransferase [Rhizobium sp. PP-F2F-G38]
MVDDAHNDDAVEAVANSGANIEADWFTSLMSHLDFGYLRLSLPGLAAASDQQLTLAYIEASATASLDPHAEFSARLYLGVNGDVAAAGIDPFFHYINYGKAEGREPWLSQWGDSDAPRLHVGCIDQVMSVFDAESYLNQAPYLRGLSARSIVSHYLAIGWRLGLEPFDGFARRLQNVRSDYVGSNDTSPLLFLMEAEMLQSSPLDAGDADSRNRESAADEPSTNDIETVRPFFDVRYYRSHNPDVHGDEDDLIYHFMSIGWQEGRDPSPNFSIDFYRDNYSDIAENGLNPFLHYILFGKAEGRRPNASEKHIVTLNPEAEITPPHLASVMRYPVEGAYRDSPARSVNTDTMDLHWIVPDFSRGGGGHMTIFRTIRLLESLGHTNTIWIENPVKHASPREAWEDIVKYFQCLRAEVNFIGAGFFEASGDAVIATGWTTAYLADRTHGFHEKFYFVQDHEPEFYPTGAEYFLAKDTYGLDLACICASPWLERIMTEKYGRWARSFDLAYDDKVYKVSASRDVVSSFSAEKPCMLAVYARDHTARRCVSLALMALEELGRHRDDFEVHFFGQDVLPFIESNFRCYNLGVLDAEELSRLYNACDIGICFSGTNYSLVPQEMMACGLPILELNSESTKEIFPEGVVTLVGPNPSKMCSEISRFINDHALRSEQASRAKHWVSQFSWEKSARDIETALKDRLGYLPLSASAPHVQRQRDIRLDVVIPTFNGVDEIKSVITSLRQQDSADLIQIHCVDSSSSDGTSEWLAKQGDIALTTIQQSEFGHGRTRNSGASQGSAEFVSFLTQDAVPASRSWAADIMRMFDHVPQASGLTGRHLPYPHHPLFVRMEIDNHFANMLKYPLVLSKYTDQQRWESGDLGWRQLLHFYSDNNSAMRRQAWVEFPYRDVEYGEDQIWAREIIDAGHTKLYSPTATVYHSHYYTPQETYKRSRIEGEFFFKYFGYELERSSDEELSMKVIREQRAFLIWARRNRVSAEDIEIGHANIERKLFGLRDGLMAALSERVETVS